MNSTRFLRAGDPSLASSGPALHKPNSNPRSRTHRRCPPSPPWADGGWGTHVVSSSTKTRTKGGGTRHPALIPVRNPRAWSSFRAYLYRKPSVVKIDELEPLKPGNNQNRTQLPAPVFPNTLFNLTVRNGLLYKSRFVGGYGTFLNPDSPPGGHFRLPNTGKERSADL